MGLEKSTFLSVNKVLARVCGQSRVAWFGQEHSVSENTKCEIRLDLKKAWSGD